MTGWNYLIHLDCRLLGSSLHYITLQIFSIEIITKEITNQKLIPLFGCGQPRLAKPNFFTQMNILIFLEYWFSLVVQVLPKGARGPVIMSSCFLYFAQYSLNPRFRKHFCCFPDLCANAIQVLLIQIISRRQKNTDAKNVWSISRWQ